MSRGNYPTTKSHSILNAGLLSLWCPMDRFSSLCCISHVETSRAAHKVSCIHRLCFIRLTWHIIYITHRSCMYICMYVFSVLRRTKIFHVYTTVINIMVGGHRTESEKKKTMTIRKLLSDLTNHGM